LTLAYALLLLIMRLILLVVLLLADLLHPVNYLAVILFADALIGISLWPR